LTATLSEEQVSVPPPLPPLPSLPRRLARHSLPIALITAIVLHAADYVPSADEWLLPLGMAFALQVGAQIAADVLRRFANPLTVRVVLAFVVDGPHYRDAPLRVVRPECDTR
jgi:hypothetical protein